jgi:hypothetical protein
MMTRWMSSRNAAEITLLGRKAYSSALSLTGLCDLTQRFNGLRQNKRIRLLQISKLTMVLGLVTINC